MESEFDEVVLHILECVIEDRLLHPEFIFDTYEDGEHCSCHLLLRLTGRQALRRRQTCVGREFRWNYYESKNQCFIGSWPLKCFVQFQIHEHDRVSYLIQILNTSGPTSHHATGMLGRIKQAIFVNPHYCWYGGRYRRCFPLTHMHPWECESDDDGRRMPFHACEGWECCVFTSPNVVMAPIPFLCYSLGRMYARPATPRAIDMWE